MPVMERTAKDPGVALTEPRLVRMQATLLGWVALPSAFPRRTAYFAC